MTRSGLLLLAFFALHFFTSNYCSANEEKELKIRTLPVYAMLANADQKLNSSQCRNELKDLRDAIDRQVVWGLKVLDASGEPESGFIYGNNFWEGSRSQCEDANNRRPFELLEDELRNNSIYRRIEDEFPPYDIKYFAAHFRHNSTMQYHIVLPKEDLITLGMCLPASCSKDQLSILLETVFRNRTLFKGQLYLADFTLLEVKDLIDDYRWLMSGTFIIMTIIVVLSFLLVIIGTIYDVMIYQKRLKKYEKYLQNRPNNNSQMTEGTENELEKIKSQSFLLKILQSYSAYSNTKIIFNTKIDVNSIPIIHGLRFITMVWIIMGHAIFYVKDYIDNKPMILRKSEGFGAQLLSNAQVAVDTFFFLGGFLITYIYLRTEINKDKSSLHNYLNTTKLFFLSILKRFLRLTPTYMIIIGMLEISTTRFSKISLFYITDRYHENCPKYWWRNILYIQNLFTLDEMCMNWSWYLANDMQFFVIINFLLLLSSMYFKVAASLFGLIFISSVILPGYIAYLYDYVPTLETQFKLFNELYSPPWVRIGPYLVGVITGFILIKLDKKLKLKKKTLVVFWILGSSCCLLALFGLSQRKIPVLVAVFHIAFYRHIWAVGIAWLVIACCTNNGGLFNHILSLKVWIPFSRLTYIAYLVNPIIIHCVNLGTEVSVHFDILTICTLFLFYFTASYMCSFIISLMFETPCLLLIKEGMNFLNIRK